jgi:hypothetical protein
LQSRAGLAEELGYLAYLIKAIRDPVLYPVEFSPELDRLRKDGAQPNRAVAS